MGARQYFARTGVKNIMFSRWLYRGVLVGSLLGLSTEPLLAQNRIIQQSSSSATAVGENNFAASQVRQHATQNSTTQPQTIEQYGHSSVTAEGENNTVVGDIYQESIQDRGSKYKYSDPERYAERNRQTSIQRATINSTIKGGNNRAISNTRQYNLQSH